MPWTSSVSLVSIFAGVVILRRLTLDRGRQVWLHNWKFFGCRSVSLASICQYYVFFMVMLVVMFVRETMNFAEIIHATEWLDPESFELHKYNLSKEERDDIRMFKWLMVLCAASYFFVLLTFPVTIVHTWQHLPAKRGFDEELRWYPSFTHDMTIQVILMPLIYGLMALSNVMKLWEAGTGIITGNSEINSDGRNYTDFVEGRLLTCKMNFEVADLYEAWALRCFAVLCTTILRKHIRGVSGLEATFSQHNGFQVDGDDLPVDENIMTVADAKRQAAKLHGCEAFTIEGPPTEEPVHVWFKSRFEMPTQSHRGTADHGALQIHGTTYRREMGLLDLFRPMQDVILLGVKCFVIVYAVKSSYLISEHIISVSLQQNLPSFFTGYDPLFSGASAVVSTLAIWNMVYLEHSLKVWLEKHDFQPFLKFLSVKFMVSISFLQDFILEIVLDKGVHYSRFQIQLCNSALIGLESLPLSILLLLAWRPHKQNYPARWFYVLDVQQDDQVVRVNPSLRAHEIESPVSSAPEAGVSGRLARERHNSLENVQLTSTARQKPCWCWPRWWRAEDQRSVPLVAARTFSTSGSNSAGNTLR